MSGLKDLQVNALYVFYTTDPDDQRIDSAFVGKLVEETSNFLRVEKLSLCPTDESRPVIGIAKADVGYRAHPLPTDTSNVWEAIPQLLVPPKGWPQSIETVKGLDPDAKPIVVGRINPKGVGPGGVQLTEIDLKQKHVAKPFLPGLARLIFQAFHWETPLN